MNTTKLGPETFAPTDVKGAKPDEPGRLHLEGLAWLRRIAMEGDQMKWVTRRRPKVDRVACPWLIGRFIDPDAEFLYVPAGEVLATAQREGGNSFDAKGATFSHRKQADGREWCTFETLIHEHHLDTDPALMELAAIVHAADVASDIDSHPFGAALRAIADAGSAVEADDQRLREKAAFIYDALYAYCQSITTREQPV